MSSLKTAATNSSPTFIDISSYGVLTAEGPDADKFLQSQLTCDVQELGSDSGKNWVRGGHCDAKGKLWSTFYLTSAAGSAADESKRYFFFMPKATLSATLKEFEKFGVFHKVEFKDISDTCRVMAVAGTNAHSAAESVSSEPVATELPEPLLLQSDLALTAVKTLPDNVQPESEWTLITISHVWPQLAESQVQQFVPQMLNLDLLDGINFKKGCYIGQETVARMHYKGQVKKRTFCVTGTASKLPEPGEQLEKQIGENWRRAGEILQAVWYDDGVVALLAVMSADTESDTRLRIKGQDDSQFTLCPDS